MGKRSLKHSEQGCGPCLTELRSQDRAGTRLTRVLLRARCQNDGLNNGRLHHGAELKHIGLHTPVLLTLPLGARVSMLELTPDST